MSDYYIGTLKEGEKILYPKTLASEVYMDDGTTVSSNMIIPADLVKTSEVTSTYENSANKTTEVSVTSTDVQYPSAKAVYEYAQPKSTVLISTLTAGSTTLEISDESITTDSLIDVYTSVYGTSPTNVVTESGKVTLTFEAQTSDIGVRVEVR